MNRLLKIIVICAITIVVCYVTYFIYGIIRYSHILSFQTYKHYSWIFADSIKEDLDTSFCYSYVRKFDVYNNLRYRSTYNIIIWEFKDQCMSDFKDITFTQNANLENVRFRSGQILNRHTDLEINIKNGFVLGNSIKVFLDEYSKIEKNIQGDNYKGFYGFINKMTLSDEKDCHQIIFDYTKGRTPTLLILYKREQSLYLIMFNSENSFDEDIINVLNLE